MRAIPGRLCMGEAVPWGQRWNYHSGHPVEMVMGPEYFLSVRNMLRVGDEIRVCRVARDRVTHLVDLLVVQKHDSRLELIQLRDVFEVPAPDAAPVAKVEPQAPQYITTTGKVKWNVGKGAFEVWAGNAVVAETADKDEANRMAQGEIPLPMAA